MGVEIGTVTRLGPTWFELDSAAPLANGDGLNYMKKREVVGLQANTVEKIGTGARGDLWRVSPNEPMQALEGLKPGVTVHRNRDHNWELALTRKSSERKVDVWLQLRDEAAAWR